MTDRPIRVLFIHGLEGSPQGSKARYLDAHFDAHTPAMDTSDFEGCIARQAEAIAAFRPDVVVGSSFGGAVLVRLLCDGAWRGPSLLLAQAARHFGGDAELPEGVAVTLVHGTRDDVVDIEGSRALARTGSPELVELVEVDDGHRLQSVVDDGRLGQLVRDLSARGRASGGAATSA